MNATQRGIITLLKSAITEQTLPLPEGFDLAQAYPLLKRHHMSTLIYDGAVRCGIGRTEPVMQRLFQNYCRLLMISEQQMEAVERIYAAFHEHDIDYMPLKGCLMKGRYPKPELRIMGDADILIRMEQYDRICTVMTNLGFTHKHESDHEIVWISETLYLELHKRLVSTSNRHFYGYFGDGWNMAKLQQGNRYDMTSEDELIYLFTHFAKHFRDGGIGCRHVVDLWVYLRTNPDLNESYVRAELEKLHLIKFYDNIRHLLDVWFDDAPESPISDLLTQGVFDSGSFGTSASKAVSQVVRGRRGLLKGADGRFVYLWRTAFPGVKKLEGQYTVLKKAPWLLPAVWLYRPIYKLLFHREAYAEQGAKLRMINDDAVDERSRVLRTIGLGEHF